MRVQSIFTYTLPATGAYAKTPPPAPINCHCSDFVLILKNQSLLKTPLKGVLNTEIKSISVSTSPVATIDGSGQTVWKYDYVIEYDTDDLTDPAYRVRKCDVEFNCCYSCAMAYADRKQLPSDSLVDNGNRSLTHTDSNGNALIFCQGVQIVAGAIGPDFAVKSALFGMTEADRCTMYLNSAPEHTSLSGYVAGGLTTPATITPADGVIITGPFPDQNELDIVNTSQRNLQVIVQLTGAFSFNLFGPASSLVYEIQSSLNGGPFLTQTSDRRGIGGAAVGSVFVNTQSVTTPLLQAFTLSPGSTVNFAGRLKLECLEGSVGLSTHSLALSWFGRTV